MKKVRKFTRKDRKGYWVSWYENGRRITKQLNTKAEQTIFANLIYQRINSDVYTLIDLPWRQLKEEYLQTYDVRGLAATSKYEASKFLRHFGDDMIPTSGKSIDQNMVDKFVLRRRQKVKSPYSVNSSISRLRAFLAWMKKRGYHRGGIDLQLVPVPELIRKKISDDDIRRIITLAESDAWRVRLLISLFTGWRKDDIDSLALDAVDLDKLTISVVQQKTRKAAVKPIPDAAAALLTKYIKSLPGGDVRLFGDINVRRAWDRLRVAGGFFEIDPNTPVTSTGQRKPTPKKIWKITRQDLRRTYATAIEMSGPMYNATDALQHSSQSVTAQHYLDRAAIERWQVNQLPVKLWLKPWEKNLQS